MKTRPLSPEHARSLGALGLAVAGLLLVGFHSVVSGALQQAAHQRAEVDRLHATSAICDDIPTLPERELCLMRLQAALQDTPAEGAVGESL